MSTVTDLQVQRLLCAIYPTRYERFLGWMVRTCYALSPSESGPFSALGDWIDIRLSHHVRRRADRHIAAQARR